MRLYLSSFRLGEQAIVSRLEGVGLVWVRGGNTFVLRRAAAASGFDRAVSDLLGRDALVYGGHSAGVCMVDDVVEWFLDHRIPFVALRDGTSSSRKGRPHECSPASTADGAIAVARWDHARPIDGLSLGAAG